MTRDQIRHDRWEDSVEVFTEDAAIRWKADQRKDRANIRSRHSEDALTWKVFRTLEAGAFLDDFVADLLGCRDKIEAALYWQRRAYRSDMEAIISKKLAVFEPYHIARNRQPTETDLILLGSRCLFVFENKLGKPKEPPAGWSRKEGPHGIRPEYAEHIKPLLASPDEWLATFARFWQLLRNLALGRLFVAEGAWAHRELHLVAIHHGAVGRRANQWGATSYTDEFLAFKSCLSGSTNRRNLHAVSWQRIGEWAAPRSELSAVARILESHPCLADSR